jgi:hypothetical protein
MPPCEARSFRQHDLYAGSGYKGEEEVSPESTTWRCLDRDTVDVRELRQQPSAGAIRWFNKLLQ